MNFTIMRCVKLKNFGAVGASLQHCFREKDTPNADQNLTAKNEHFYASSENEAMGKLRSLLPEKIRKNGVIAIEYMITASPEWFASADAEKRSEFFKRSIQWLKDKYGEENIFTASIHNDETTPHLSAFVCPKTKDGRLCAREFIGGTRDKLSKDLDSIAEKMQDLGLMRGIKGSKAKHKDISKFYAELNKTMDINSGINTEDLKPKKVNKWNPFAKESPEQVAQRINRKIEPFKAQAMQYQALEQRCKNLEKQNQELSTMNASLKKFRDKFAELTDNDFEQVNAIIRNRHQSNAMLKQIEKTSQEQRKILRREEQAKRQGIHKGMEH